MHSNSLWVLVPPPVHVPRGAVWAADFAAWVVTGCIRLWSLARSASRAVAGAQRPPRGPGLRHQQKPQQS